MAPSPLPAVSRAPSAFDRTGSAQAAFDRSADLEARLAGAKNRLAGVLAGRDDFELGSNVQARERRKTLELANKQAEEQAELRETRSSAVAASLADTNRKISIERKRQARAVQELSAVRAQIAGAKRRARPDRAPEGGEYGG